MAFVPAVGKLFFLQQDQDRTHGRGPDDIHGKVLLAGCVEKHVGPGKHGTGLGLAICRDLIQLHSGRIWIEDNPGGGAVFRILLPKCEDETVEEEAAALAESSM